MTNPHTPIPPVPRDESDQSAWDSMASCGDWFWGTLAALAGVGGGYLFLEWFLGWEFML